MTVTLKKGQRLEDVLPEKIHSGTSKKLNAEKFVGKIKSNKNPVSIQKDLRNDWDETTD